MSAGCIRCRGASAAPCRRAPGRSSRSRRRGSSSASGPAPLATSPSSTSGRPTRSSSPQASWTSCRFPSPGSGCSGAGKGEDRDCPMPKRRQLRSFDLKKIEGFESLIGVDEVGRGALAGPVVAGAVLVTRDFLGAEFESLAAQGQIHAHYGSASVEEIEQHNILGATKLAMRRAMEGIYPVAAFRRREEPDLFSSVEERESFIPAVSCRVLVDGLPLRGFPYPHTAVVRGDSRSLCIAMASIIAKVARDRLMAELDAMYPGYGFGRHKGYGTDDHRDAVVRLGRSPIHREMFLRKLVAQRADPDQMDFLPGR